VPAKVRVRGGDDLAELSGSQMISAVPLGKVRDVEDVAGPFPTANSPWFAMSDRPVADALGDFVGELVGAGRLVVGDFDITADEHVELLDHRRDRAPCEREHRGELGVAVHRRIDVVMEAQGRQVQRLLRGGAARALEHVAIEVGDDEVVERHLEIVE
jgi:hypothetical protein